MPKKRTFELDFEKYGRTHFENDTVDVTDIDSDSNHSHQLSLQNESAAAPVSFHNSENDGQLTRPIECGDGPTFDIDPLGDKFSVGDTSSSDISDDYYSPSASCSDESDHDDFDFDTQKLSSDLANWAAVAQIPQSKLRGLMSVLRKYHPELPKDPRTLLQTVTDYEITNIAGGEYYHFGVADGINRISEICIATKDATRINLQINIDGLPLFKSSKTQFWPILGRISMPFESETFIIGLYCGESKPHSVQHYLTQFVSEMKGLEESGGVMIKSTNDLIPISIACFICDAPARAFVKQTKPHNAYYGCDKCVQKGDWSNKVIFPETDSPLRTDSAFKNMVQKEHHNNKSPISELSVGLVSQFPLDPMHLVHLGVVKRLIWSWTKGPIRCRISANMRRQISDCLLSCRPFVPREFPRKCRPLSEFERWKATELRQFIIYSGPVVLKGKLSDDVYLHFLLLSVSIYCLSSSLYLPTYCDYVKELLDTFVKMWAGLYGRDMLVYNVHGLTHLAADAKKFGPLDSYSAFPFESFLGRLKKVVRKPHRCLPQVIRRLSENKIGGKDEKKSNDFCLGPEHTDGPILLAHKRHLTQHRYVQFNGLYFSAKDSDSCIQIGSRYGLIRNIIQDPQNLTVMVMFQQFMRVDNFFQRPLDSSDLGIVKVSRLSDTLKAEKLSEIVCKLYRIPYKESFVLVPLVHQFC
uniref:Transposase domain-containing protein n=1 Tax=Strongylocentrotus purpuratus TaxID=7668 RepID=A0JPS3_STRPU|nr:TPA: transposase domain-containing protein [Strongylocentrotus purpuratus]